jgi:hypothetical protein
MSATVIQFRRRCDQPEQAVGAWLAGADRVEREEFLALVAAH